MQTTMPCWTDSEELNRLPPDEPEPEAPVWIKSEQCISAVEKSAKADSSGLCRVWAQWRDSHDLLIMLHGFLMITGLRTFDAAWGEIDFLVDVLYAEAEAAAIAEAAERANNEERGEAA